MRFTLINSIVVFTAIFAALNVFGASKNAVKLSHVKGHVYVAEDSFYYPENTVVYVGEKTVTVISATWTPETAKLLADEVKKITDKPIETVVDTHFHLDRSGGNAYFKKIGAKIIASKKTAELMDKNWSRQIKGLQKDIPDFPNVKKVAPDVTFDGRYELEDGKIKLIYFGPSHTQDDIFAYFPEEKILDGDCALKEFLGNLDDADLKEYPNTLKKLKTLSFDTIIAGHGSPLHGPELIDQFLEMLKKRATK